MLTQMIRTLVKLKFKEGYDGDFVDRLNHKYTALLLVFFGSMVAGKQYGGDPITCWCPGHFTSNWIEYTNTICWVTNTYFLPLNKILELAKQNGNDLEIKYYQWTPIILMVMGLMFYLPYMIWKFACFAIGIDMDNVIATLTTFDAVISPEIWHKTLEHVVHQFERFIDGQRETRKGLNISAKKVCFLFNKRCGGYLTSLYIMLKALYIINIYSLLFLLNGWLGEGFHYYGVETFSNSMLMSSTNPEDSGLGQAPSGVNRWMGGNRFPYVTMCDFTARIMGNLHGYTVQCVLTINIFNEKIFLLIWAWFIAVAVITTVNFGVWTFRIVWCGDRLSYIQKHLKFSGRIHDNSGHDAKRNVRKFTHGYLRSDGIFLIRLISKNTSSLITSELVARLYDNYVAKPRFDTHGNLRCMNNIPDKMQLVGAQPASAPPFDSTDKLAKRSSGNCDWEDQLMDEDYNCSRGFPAANVANIRQGPNANTLPPQHPPPGFMEATRGSNNLINRRGFVSSNPGQICHPLSKSNSIEVGFPVPEILMSEKAKLGLEMMENPLHYNHTGNYISSSTIKINKEDAARECGFT